VVASESNSRELCFVSLLLGIFEVCKIGGGAPHTTPQLRWYERLRRLAHLFVSCDWWENVHSGSCDRRRYQTSLSVCFGVQQFI